MNFLRENKIAYDFVEKSVMAKITGDILQVDAKMDKEAIEDLQAEAGVRKSDDIVLREDVEDNSEIKYEAPDEIPMDEGATV
jgi:hypothetical protein